MRSADETDFRSSWYRRFAFCFVPESAGERRYGAFYGEIIIEPGIEFKPCSKPY